MANILLSAFSDEYAAPFKEQLCAMRELGIHHIEVRGIDGKNVSELTDDERLTAKQLLDEYGIRVSAIGSPIGKISLDGDMDAHLAMARRVFETAKLFDTRLVRVFSFYPPEGKDIGEMKEAVLTAMARLIALAKDYGIILCHENEARIFGDTPARIRILLDHFGGDLRCVYDMGNYVLEGVDPLAAYPDFKKDIAYFHIKDALYAGAIVPPGTGEAKIKEILSLHKDYASEDFFVSLEPHLECFSGLHKLVGRSFENPYKYETPEAAFTDAVQKFKELLA